MLHLSLAHKGLLMPPDCIKSGVLDEDGAAPVGLDIAKDSNKIMAEPGTLLAGSKYCMLAVVCGLLGQACRLQWFRRSGFASAACQTRNVVHV